MVKAVLQLFLMSLSITVTDGQSAFAIQQRTISDLAVLEDSIRNKAERDPNLQGHMLPMLVAKPKHLWQASREDFEAHVLNTLNNVFKQPSSLIICAECNTNRVQFNDDQNLVINNGELSVIDFMALKQYPQYRAAKSMAVIEETPSGISMKVVGVNDGAILFFALADSSKTLDDAKPYLNYAQELERRKRAESLAYVFIDVGFYPNPLLQVEFVEQWGAYNQHMTGVVLGVWNPTMAIGASYRFIIPRMKRLNIGVAGFYSVAAMFGSSNSSALGTDKVVFQGMAQYAFSSTFGVFSSFNSQGQLALGLNFFNPLFMPFLL